AAWTPLPSPDASCAPRAIPLSLRSCGLASLIPFEIEWSRLGRRVRFPGSGRPAKRLDGERGQSAARGRAGDDQRRGGEACRAHGAPPSPYTSIGRGPDRQGRASIVDRLVDRRPEVETDIWRNREVQARWVMRIPTMSSLGSERHE